MAADDKAGMLHSHLSPMSSMQPVQQYLYESNGQHAPDYRASQQQQHTAMSHAPLLPPIQHFDGQNMQSQHSYPPASMNGAQMSPHPPPSFHPNQFQYPNGGMQPPPMPSNVGANGQMGVMRYPIPPQGPMPMSGSRGKASKDVKRRTKTGCLTCRKRRIKCDEGHPTCGNCRKSKRECLGYDPIFKPQPGPAAIQPAPGNSSTPTSKSTLSPPPLPHNAYQQPHSYPGTGGTFVPANNPAQGADGLLEYSTSLDPALSGSDAPHNMAANSFSTSIQTSRRVKPVTMEQLFALHDVQPRFERREAPLPNSLPPQKDIDEFYRFHYATGLDKLFETHWYSSRGPACLQKDPSLLDFVAQCMDQIRSRADDLLSTQALQALEARLVWHLAAMPRSASLANSANGTMNDRMTADLLPRIDTMEQLLTGQFLPQSRMVPPPASQPEVFWHELSRFTSIRDDVPDPDSLRDIKDALGIMRGALGMTENRDVLYSIAIARHIGGRSTEFHPPRPVVPQTDDPNDEVKKLQVAYQFVESEDQRGTTQVIQRICGMAIRSWILQKR